MTTVEPMPTATRDNVSWQTSSRCPAARPVRRQRRGAAWPARWTALLLSLWLAGGAALVLTSGRLPVQRTQEARVLVTAREMLGAPWRQWLIPRCNGDLRMRKPPLAYWLSAASFAALGVSEVSGRLPATVAAWLMLALTYAVGNRLFGRRAGLLSAVAMFGSLGFLHYSNLAETDILAALFVTSAVAAMWRGYGLAGTRARACEPERAARLRAAGWYCAGAAAIALAVLTKGPPGAYPLLFLVALALLERNGRAVRHWSLSGAPVVMAAIAAPWFVYVYNHALAGHLTHDMANSAAGGTGHRDWFFEYVPHLLALLAPWSGLAVLSLVWASRRWCDPRVRGLLVWTMSVVVPLCFWGNKQPHYLLPALPPIVLLMGWTCDRALRPRADRTLVAWARLILIVTAAGMAFMALVLPALAWLRRGGIDPADLILAGTIAAFAAAAATAFARGARSPALVATVGGFIVTMPLIARLWAPSLTTVHPGVIARQIRQRHGDVPYAFYGEAENLALCFHMRAVIPNLLGADAVARAAAAQPGLVLIEATSTKASPAPAPDGYTRAESLTEGSRTFVVYEPTERPPPSPL